MSLNRVQGHFENAKNESESLMKSIDASCNSLCDTVRANPMTSVVVGVAVGLTVGTILGKWSALGSETRATHPRIDTRSLQGFRDSLVDAVVQALPDSLKKSFLG